MAEFWVIFFAFGAFISLALGIALIRIAMEISHLKRQGLWPNRVSRHDRR